MDIKIKWGKKEIKITVEPEETIEMVKAKLYSITSVPPNKLKLIYKGKTLKDDNNISYYKILKNSNILMMGKPEGNEVVFNLNNQKKFLEDMTEEEQAKYYKEVTGKNLPIGLVNLGNTCYLNSIVQMLKRIPEFKSDIENYNSQNQDQANYFINTMKNVYLNLDKSSYSVEPTMFVTSFMNIFPEFSQKTQHGAFEQQDVDEGFMKITHLLEPFFKNLNNLFEIDFQVKMFNTEEETEDVTYNYEKNKKLSCIIDNKSNPVNNLMDGLKSGLEEEVEKMSTVFDRNCLYKKQLYLNNLPPYLLIHKVRFFWKEKDMGTLNNARSAKILKSVVFPQHLDVYDLCSNNLKNNLYKNRTIQKEREDSKPSNIQRFDEFKKNNTENLDSMQLNTLFKKQEKEREIKEHNRLLNMELGSGLMTGDYELVSVITHKGRSIDSGHYINWSHFEGDDWIKYDDDEITKVKIDDILNLKGGGDWHTGYYLLYRRKEIDI